MPNLVLSGISPLKFHLAQFAAFLCLRNRPESFLEVVFLPPKTIKRLNLQFRGKNIPTDVLSFSGEGDYLGSIAICPELIRQKNPGVYFPIALYKTFIHAILHLLGHDHESDSDHAAMHAAEEEIWREFVRLIV